jgi:hypothetical protein
MKISNRAVEALRTLAAGGSFVERLERNFNGQMKFKTRLYDSAGALVKGIGGQTRHEIAMLARGVMLAYESRSGGDGYTYWIASAAAMPAEDAVRFDEVMQAV